MESKATWAGYIEAGHFVWSSVGEYQLIEGMFNSLNSMYPTAYLISANSTIPPLAILAPEVRRLFKIPVDSNLNRAMGSLMAYIMRSNGWKIKGMGRYGCKDSGLTKSSVYVRADV